MGAFDTGMGQMGGMNNGMAGMNMQNMQNNPMGGGFNTGFNNNNMQM